jgi:hypothetical protein
MSKHDAFISSAQSMKQLPIESMNEFLGMVIKQADSSENIPDSILLFLRVFHNPTEQGVKPYAILESSPLLAYSNSPPQTWDSAKTSREISQWTLQQVFRSIDKVHKRAWELYKEVYPTRCSTFLAEEGR